MRDENNEFLYEGVEDELGLAPHTQEIRQEARNDSRDHRDILEQIKREKWL